MKTAIKKTVFIISTLFVMASAFTIGILTNADEMRTNFHSIIDAQRPLKTYNAEMRVFEEDDAKSLFMNKNNLLKSTHTDISSGQEGLAYKNETQEQVYVLGNSIQYYNLSIPQNIENLWQMLLLAGSENGYIADMLDSVPPLSGMTLEEAIAMVKQKLIQIDEVLYDQPSIVFCINSSVISSTVQAYREYFDFTDSFCPEFYYIEMPMVIDNVPFVEYNILDGYSDPPGVSAIVTADGVVEMIISCSYDKFRITGENEIIDAERILKSSSVDVPNLSTVTYARLKYIGNVLNNGTIQFFPIWAFLNENQEQIFICDAFTGEKLHSTSEI